MLSLSRSFSRCAHGNIDGNSVQLTQIDVECNICIGDDMAAFHSSDHPSPRLLNSDGSVYVLAARCTALSLIADI